MRELKRRTPARMGALLFLATVIHSAGLSAHDSDPSPPDRVISVTGSAMASHEPDLVNVRFGVEIRRPSSAEALGANADLMQEVIEALEDAGVERDEIGTSQFNIHAVYDNRPDRETGGRTQVLTGYQVSNILLVETAKLDLVAQIIDSAVAAGVNRVDGVQFALSPEVRADLKDRLIEEAVLDARSKAEKALAPLAYVITGVRNVALTDFSSPRPVYAEAARMDMVRSAPTQIFASDQDVRTTVQVTFLIGPAPEAE